jgi:NADH-quinone oxidoreductase subunit F
VLAVYGGSSNSVITADMLDLPLDFDALVEAGTGLGSGGFIVYDRSRDIVQVCAALTRFLAVESCGQCLPCKLGTTDMQERLERIVAGTGTAADLDAIRTTTTTVTDSNRCYLPVGAALLVRSTMDAFAEDFAAHLGVASDPAVAVPIPKMEAIDHDTGAVRLDGDYDRKRHDWSYAPPL